MNVPKLRYKDFTEQWKEDKLSNLFSIKSSGDLKKDKLSPTISEEHIYPVYGNALTNDGLLGFYKDFTETAPSITVTGRGEIGKPIFRKNEYNAVGRLLVLHPKNAFIDSYYFTLLISILDIFNETTGVPQLTAPSLGSYPVKFPTYNEQLKIASLFKALDNRIQLQQEKIDLLKEQKKGYMQKIFTQELRFKDKDGLNYPDWSQQKLGNFSERVTRKNSNLETTRPLTISAQHGLIDQVEFFNKTVASDNLTGYYLLSKGQFAYNKSYSNGYPLGAIKRLDNYENGALSTLYICFTPKNNVNSNFLVHYFDSTEWHKEVSLICVEGARNHGLLNVSVNEFFETQHYLPCLDEQEKIANFFDQVNKKIILYEQTLFNLQLQKQAFMQQMFI